MTTTFDELNARITTLKAAEKARTEELRSYVDRIGNRTATPGEDERINNLSRSVLNARTEYDQAVGEMRRAMADAHTSGSFRTESGDGATARLGYIDRSKFDDPWNTRSDLFGSDPATADLKRAEACLERVRFPENVDRDATVERAAKLIQQAEDTGDRVLAEWIAATSNPDYSRGMSKVLSNPTQWPALLDDREREAFRAVQTPGMQSLIASRNERAAMSLTGANGGYLVPFTLDPSVVLTNDGAMNPMREISSVVTITTDDWNGVTSAGVTAEWLAEAAEVADASPTFTQPNIPVHKGAAYLQASLEVNMDSGISNEISNLIQDAKERMEATAFITGTGSGQPTGVVTALNLVTASRVAGSSGAAGAADFVLADVYALDDSLPYRYRKNPAWLAEITTYNKIRRFGEGSTANSAFWTELGGGRPPQLLGHPAYEASAMDDSIVSGSNDNVLILGDFRHSYKIVDRIGTTIVFNPLVLGANRRPTGEVGWFAFFRTGADIIDANGLRMLRL